MLVEDVKKAGLDYGMFDRIREAWTWWKEWCPSPARVRVVGDDDSDGVTSAHQVATTLKRQGYEVDLKVMPIHSPEDVAVAFNEPRDGYVVLDAGSAVVDAIDSYRVPTLILDHHRVNDFRPENTFEVNPRRLGGDKVEHVSTSVLAAMFAVEVGDYWDVTFAGVAGGISDRQHLGGFKGLLGWVADGAVLNSVLTRSQGLTLVGTTVLDAIVDSLDPFFEQYSGQPDNARKLLDRHGIPGRESPILVSGENGLRLAKELTQGLLERGVVTDRMHPLYDERFLLRHASGVQSVLQLAQYLEAATASKAHEVALRMLGGDPAAARQAHQIHKRRADGILGEVARLRTDVKEMKNLRWAETRDGANTGVYAHTLLTFIFGDDKPFLVLSRSGEKSKLSSRGSPKLYHAGLDLSIALGQAAQAVGGHGGGHPGASGATIPYAKREEFLGHVDRVLGELRKKGPA